MIFDTLQYVDGSGTTQEIALSLANLATAPAVKLVMTPASHAAGTFRITWLQAPETGINIPFKSRCVVYAGRTSTDGSANSFSGGTILFQGRRTDNAGSASASRVMSDITLSDAWWDLEKVVYQMAWQQITGGTWASPTYTPFYWPDLVLFQASPGTTYSPAAVNSTITTWQTIQEILSYATGYASGANAVQLQTTSSAEFTPVYCNWYTLRSGKCAEALLICLRPHPGVFTEMDYTTTPPTLHFRNRANLTAVTLPYKSTDGNGIIHVASDIQSLDELVPDAVRLYYKVTSTFNGQPVVSPGTDIYPAGSANSLMCLDYSIDVTGANLQQIQKNFVSATFDPTVLSLWRYKVPALKQVSEGGLIPNDGAGAGIALTLVDSNPYNSSTHPKGIQVLDESGAAVDLTTFTYLTDQSVYSWFKLGSGTAQVVKATVKAYFKYRRTTTISSHSLTDNVQEHEHSMRVILTNVPSGTYVLKQTLNVGEAIPSGLAQALYTELSVLQWKLKHEIFQTAATASAVPTIIKPGKHCINLSGGASAWTSMNAAPERVSIEFFRTGNGLLAAQHSISCGPVNHLEPGYIVQLTNLFWNRNKSGIDPFQRLSGTVSSTQVDLSATDAKENSTPAQALYQSTNLLYLDGGGNPAIIQHDASQLPANATSAHRPISCCDDAGNIVTGYFQCTPPA